MPIPAPDTPLRRPIRWILTGLLPTFLVCGIGQNPARAGLIIVSADAHGYFDATPREEGQDGVTLSNDLAGKSSQLSTSATMSFSNGSLATARSEAAIGTLRAFGEAQFPAAYGQGYITGSAAAQFAEKVHLSGGAGTPFSYKITVVIDGVHSLPGFEIGGSFSADAVASVRLSDNYGLYDTYKNWGSTDTELGITLTAIVSGTVVNDSHFLTYSGTLAVGAYVSGSSVYRHAVSDYHSTAHFYLDSLTPGANTIGESGYDFATPTTAVPEPDGALLLATTLFALSSLGLWRRRSRTPNRTAAY